VSRRYRLVGYSRVSDTRGREETLISPEIQRDQMEGYAKSIPAEIVAWKEDLDYTGRNADRPAFMEAVAMVERREVDGLIVSKINRFARSSADAGAIVRRIEKAGGVFISAAERLDPTPHGRFVRTLFFAMAELESDIIAENWSEAQRKAVAGGKHISPWIPAGFYKSDEGFLAPHPDYAPVIVDAFERRAAGQDAGIIARMLSAAAVPKSKGSTHWTTAEVHRMFQRRIYIGELTHAGHSAQHNELALVDLGTWDTVQSMRTPRLKRAQKHDYLLSGIARCAGCGYALRANTASAAMVKKGSKPGYITYRCAGNHLGGECPAKGSAPGDALERYVVDTMFALTGALRAGSATDTAELREAEIALGNAQAELEAYLSLESALGEHFVAGLTSRKSVVDQRKSAVIAIRTRLGIGLPGAADLLEEWPTWGRDRQRLMLSVRDRRRLWCAARRG
jgi:DNA invertase Pin-like site-specific DNA recombinase